jgi:diguanylate cyclase (GGDEF)-like protein
MEKLAVTDSLTGLNNRRYFFELGQSEVERARRYHRHLSAILLDIDHFKHVNDTYGHLGGDIALQAVAQCCRKATRKSDLIGRYGGEEFAILLPETDLEDATRVAERLRQIIEEKYIVYKDGQISLTASLGVAYLDGRGDTLDNLLDRSDQNMYEAKQAGRNQVYSCLLNE